MSYERARCISGLRRHRRVTIVIATLLLVNRRRGLRVLTIEGCERLLLTNVSLFSSSSSFFFIFPSWNETSFFFFFFFFPGNREPRSNSNLKLHPFLKVGIWQALDACCYLLIGPRMGMERQCAWASSEKPSTCLVESRRIVLNGDCSELMRGGGCSWVVVSFGWVLFELRIVEFRRFFFLFLQ